jgi:hypothetical protein
MDDPADVSSQDGSGRHLLDEGFSTRNRKVEGSNPSSGSKTAGQRAFLVSLTAHRQEAVIPLGWISAPQARPAPLRYVGVRLADSEPVDGPPSSAHDERNRGRRTISRPCGPGAHSRAFQKTRLRLRRQSRIQLPDRHIPHGGAGPVRMLTACQRGCLGHRHDPQPCDPTPPAWQAPPGWCRLTSFGSCGRPASHLERRHGA